MTATKHDNAFDFTKCPYLTRRRVCLLADCHPQTVKRSPLVPVGRRGRAVVYKTSDVLDWIAGRLNGGTHTEPQNRERARDEGVGTEAALARLRELRGPQ